MNLTGALHLEVLPASQRALWDRLGEVPREFVLYGGTAVALRFGHRASVDFDFFGPRAFDPGELSASMRLLDGAETVRQAPSTLVCRVGGADPVLVSFFGLPRLRRVAEPAFEEPPGIAIASLLDLAGTKAAVVQRRAEAKDYLDLDALVSRGVPLSTALAAALAIYGPELNPELTLKSLCYFEDGDLGTLSPAVRDRLCAAVRATDPNRLHPLAALGGIR